jgi:hypothetical protein
VAHRGRSKRRVGRPGDTNGPGHQHADDLVPRLGSDPWAGGVIVRGALDVDAAAKQAVARLSTEDVQAALEQNNAAQILSVLGIPAKKISHSVASQVMARMRVRTLTADPVPFEAVGMSAFLLLTAGLAPEVLSELTSGEPGRGMAAWTSSPNFDQTGGYVASLFKDIIELPLAAQQLALLATIARGGANATLALGLLAVDDEDAAAAWEELEAAGADLPARPVRNLSQAWGLVVDQANDVGVGAQEPAVDNGLMQVTGETLDDLGLVAAEQPHSWLTFQALPTLLERLVSGVVRGDYDVATATEVSEALAQLSGEIDEGMPSTGASSWLKARWDEENSPPVPKNVDAWRLSGVDGPAELGDELSFVRDLAWGALDGTADDGVADRLAALTALVDLAGRRREGQFVSFAQLQAAKSRALTAHPDLPGVVDAAAAGFLSLGDDPGEDTRRAGPLPERRDNTDPAVPGPDAMQEAVDSEDADAPVVTNPDAPARDAVQDAGESEDEVSPALKDRLMDDAPPATVSPDPVAPEAQPGVPDPREPRHQPHVEADAHKGAANETGDTTPDDVTNALALLAAAVQEGAADGLVEKAPDPGPSPTHKSHELQQRHDDESGDDDDATTTDAALDWDNDTVTAAADTAANDLRLGLSADIAHAAGASAASVSARRAAAFAADLRAPGGQLAAAFSEEAASLSRDSLGDDRSGQLLAWAAAARIALLAPDAGPGNVLEEFAPCVEGLPGLSAVGSALISGTRSGAIVLPEAKSHLGSVVAAEAELEGAEAAVAELVGTRNRRVLNYQPANAIYQEWLGRDGPLGKLLDQLREEGRRQPSDLRSRALELRGQGEREAKRAHRRNLKSNQIFEPVLRDLEERWERALDTVVQWCDATTRVSSSAAATAETWQTNALAKVRTEVERHRDQALADVEDPSVANVADAVRDLLQDALDACNGQAPDPLPEPPTELVLHGDLLALATPLPRDLSGIDSDTLAPMLPALMDLAQGDAPDVETQYRALARAGHHDLTASLLRLTASRQPELVAALEKQRARDVADRGQKRDATTSALRRSLDTQRMSGGMTEEAWASLSTRVDALFDRERTDFGRITVEVAQLRDTLDELLRQRIAETSERIDVRAADNPKVAEVADRLHTLASSGNIAAAEEYLEQAAAGEPLPKHDEDLNTDLLAFFPRVPDALQAAGPDGGIGILVKHLQRGQGAENVLTAAGVDLAALPAGRAREARNAFDGMRELLQSATARQLPHRALASVLSQAGIDFANYTSVGPITGKRRWATLTGVSVTGKALTPALGSGRAPDPSTLRVLVCWGDQQPQSLIDWVRDEPNDRTVVAIWLGAPITSAQRRAMAESARGRPHPVVAVLDAAALLYLATRPLRSLSTFASISLPFTGASPFKDTPGDAAPEMFYGRREELNDVLAFDGPCFVSGGRQLGKSALLRAAERAYPGGDTDRVAVLRNIYTIGVDGDSSRLWPALWTDLSGHGICPAQMPEGDGVAVGEALIGHITAWLQGHPSRGLLILLDEADTFLDADADGNRFTVVDQCRSLMNNHRGRVKLVFAGLHRTARFDSLPNQPLSHLGQIPVGPLAPAHAHALVTRPLAAIGLHFEDPTATPARILALANNMPALIQLFGAALVRHLTSRSVGPADPPQFITDDDVDTVWDDPELRRAFREKYVLTLNLDHRYLVIAYTVAFFAHTTDPGSGMTLQELSTQARATWPEGFRECGADDFRALVSECVDLGLLSREGTRYRMRTPTVLRLLGTHEEILETLATASDALTVPDPSAGGSYRRPMRAGVARSPLTERQLGDILDGHGHATLITGAPGTGIETVITALVEAPLGHQVTSVRRIADVQALTSLPLNTLAVLDLRGASSDHVADAVSTVVPQRVALAVVADTSSVNAWSATERQVSLRRVDLTGLRLLADEAGLPFHTKADIAELLSTTGGWPALIADTMAKAHGATVAPTRESLLAAVRTKAPNDRKALLSSVVGPPGMLRSVFEAAAALTRDRAEPFDEIAEVAPELIGDADAQAVVGNLRALLDIGALEVTPEGLARAEPVLAGCLPGQETA